MRTQSLVRRATPFLGIAAVFAVATATGAPELLAFPLFLIVVISSALFDNRAQLLAVGGVATLAVLILSLIHLGPTSNLATAVFEVAVLAIVAGSVHEVVQHVRAAEGSAEKKATDLETDDARLHMVMEAATIGLGVATADGRWLQVNERLGTILGLGRGELMQTGLLEVTTDDDRHAVADALGQLGRREILRWESEVEQAGPHGRPIPVSLAIAALSDHSTEPVLLVQVTDISARKRLDSMRDALVAVRQVIVTANSWDQGAAAVLGSFCAHLDWDIAQYWSVDVEKHSLHLRNSWRGDDSN
ncbi:MAG TPA: PAS domain S-box protein, partial [Methylomirabilota bacterium]|nr:PAS domain S-box protein [Methylomirabilota bacterium]